MTEILENQESRAGESLGKDKVCTGSRRDAPAKVLPVILALILLLALLPAQLQAASEDSLVGEESCARQIWLNSTQDVWFYNEAGERVVPEVNYEWLVIRFREDVSGTSGPAWGPKPFISRFNALFHDQITDTVCDPTLDSNLCFYRIVSPENSALLASEMAAADGGALVRYVRPAYAIGEENFALLDEIEIRWKTLTGDHRKSSLLSQIDPDAVSVASSRDTRVRVDPCRIAVWEAANLMAEDLFVVSARPLLAKIENPVRASFSVGINGTTVGSPIPFSLEIAFSDRVRIEPSTIANLNLRPQELFRNLFRIEYDKPLSSVEVTRSPIQLEGNLYLYGTGDFTLPSVPVYYLEAGEEGGGLRMIHTPEIPLRIASRIPEASGDYRLKVADPGVVPEFRGENLQARKAIALTLTVIGAFLLLVCGLGFRRKVSYRAELRRVEREQEPEGEAGKILRDFLGAEREGIERGEIAAFGRAFRSYLGEVCSLSEESLGGGAGLFFDTVQDCLPPEIRPEVCELLDLVETGLTQGKLRPDEVGRMVEHGRKILLSLESVEAGKIVRPHG